MEVETSFTCVYCFSVNETMVDTTGGMQQVYVEDCQVCCRPNQLTITVGEDLGTAEIVAEPL
ncbi:MAG: CPXCG motif-containing cysteine-rich protein [Bacteroidota bacterium]